jgi:hypothetical protein
MTLEDFCAKVESEGGVLDALRYGLKADDLTSTELLGAELYDIWEALEAAWTSIGRLEEEASRIVDSVLDQADDHDGDL